MKIQKLVIYTNLKKEEVLHNWVWLMENYEDSYYNIEDLVSLFYEGMEKLLFYAKEYGLTGNLWQAYLTNLLVNDENEYSIGCEIRGAIEGSINQMVLHDLAIIKELYDYDFSTMLDELGLVDLVFFQKYEKSNVSKSVYNPLIEEVINQLAKDFLWDKSVEEMKNRITLFYQQYGVGQLGLHKGFRIKEEKEVVKIEPISNLVTVQLDDLVGYTLAKQRLIKNTQAFVSGKKANNCLLHGDAGTGKSSCIKALIHEYYGQGLRIIEVYKHQIKDLNEIIAQIKNRNYKFIIYMDDLSFEDFEVEYKYLKAIIEGGLETKPDNVLIYATSNRRHLIREKFSDKEERKDDLHASDTVQEKLSLVYRFGVNIYFGAPDPKEFEEIVKVLAKRNQIKMAENELLAKARQWEIRNGGYSGRTAQQFIDDLSNQY